MPLANFFLEQFSPLSLMRIFLRLPGIKRRCCIFRHPFAGYNHNPSIRVNFHARHSKPGIRRTLDGSANIGLQKNGLGDGSYII